MKIFYWGDSPSVDTGFGVVAKNILPRLSKMGHEIVALGVNEYGDNPRKTAEFDFIIYPCDKGGPEQVYGIRKFWTIVEVEKPDIVFMVNDPWIIQNIMEIKPPHISPYIKYVAYYPTDAAPLKPSWIEMLNGFDAQVCYSKYAERVVTASNEGVRPDNLYQIYHGVDTDTFYPMSQAYARSQIGLPEDLFIVGMIARNQPRKRFDLLAMGFAEFAKDKENVKLYLHTGLRDVGFDINDLARQLKISDKLILTEGITPVSGVPPEQLNFIHNSFDVHALISLGDGFGLPTAESMAVACPQIVSGHSCLQELVEGHGGYTIKNAAWMLNSSGMNTWGGVSDVGDITAKLEELYANPEKRIRMGEEAYKFITQEKFTWDFTTKEFNTIFKKIHHVL